MNKHIQHSQHGTHVRILRRNTDPTPLWGNGLLSKMRTLIESMRNYKEIERLREDLAIIEKKIEANIKRLEETHKRELEEKGKELKEKEEMARQRILQLQRTVARQNGIISRFKTLADEQKKAVEKWEGEQR